MKNYSSEQILGIFDHKASGIQTYIENTVKEDSWITEFSDEITEAVAEAITGFFGPDFKGRRPGREELLKIIEQAVSDAVASDEEVNDTSADKSERNSPAGWSEETEDSIKIALLSP